jgi:hypothetical protein
MRRFRADSPARPSGRGRCAWWWRRIRADSVVPNVLRSSCLRLGTSLRVSFPAPPPAGFTGLGTSLRVSFPAPPPAGFTGGGSASPPVPRFGSRQIGSPRRRRRRRVLRNGAGFVGGGRRQTVRLDMDAQPPALNWYFSPRVAPPAGPSPRRPISKNLTCSFRCSSAGVGLTDL